MQHIGIHVGYRRRTQRDTLFGRNTSTASPSGFGQSARRDDQYRPIPIDHLKLVRTEVAVSLANVFSISQKRRDKRSPRRKGAENTRSGPEVEASSAPGVGDRIELGTPPPYSPVGDLDRGLGEAIVGGGRLRAPECPEFRLDVPAINVVNLVLISFANCEPWVNGVSFLSLS